jgi:hypothetical protein
MACLPRTDGMLAKMGKSKNQNGGPLWRCALPDAERLRPRPRDYTFEGVVLGIGLAALEICFCS